MRSKKALKNIMVSLLLQIAIIICGFITQKMIIENFGSAINGLISSITHFLWYIIVFEFGIGPVIKATIYKPIANKNKEEIEKILKVSEKFFHTISYIFIIYLIVLCIAFPIIMNNQFDWIFTLSLVIIIAISTFAEYYFGMTYRLYLQAEQKTYVADCIQIGTTILNTVAVVVLIKLGFNIQIVKLISVLIYILRPILQNIYVRKKYNINLKNVPDDYKLEKKWDGLAQHIASVIHNNTDVAVLTIFSSVVEVSVYSVYMLVVKGIKSIVQAFTGGVDASFGDMIAKGEKETLNKSFKTYELFYFTTITIVYSVALLTIIPFEKVYTAGIHDADYIRPLFAYIIILAEFVHSIRLPYSSIALAAGHFKETRIGAWVEASINVILSVTLVINFGIEGVAIGTLVAMIIRTIEFMIHTSKYILNRDIKYCFKRIVWIVIEVGIITIVSAVLPSIEVTSYITWVLYASMIAIVSSIVTIVMNSVLYKNETKELIKMIKRNFVNRKE